MADRIYLSNLLPHWPIKRQEDLLDERVPGWRKAKVFRDIIPPRKRQSHAASELEERAALVRPTGRQGGETIIVATAGVMAWATADFLDVLQAITKRGAVLRLLQEDLTIAPDGGVPAAAAAMAAFERSKIKSTGEGPRKGGRISGELREKATKDKCEAFRHLWERPRSEYTDRQVADAAGVSITSMKHHLQKRPLAIHEREEREAAVERNIARRKRREQT